MAFDIGNNVKETTSTAGTGAFALLGAAAGAKTFASQITNGTKTLYTRWNSAGDLEVGVGTFSTGPDTITPLHPGTALLYSTNGGGLISWSGTQNVACGIPAEVLKWFFDPEATVGLVERTVAWPPTYLHVPIAATGKSLIALASEGAIRTFLSLVIGTNVQAWDADLDTIAGLAKTAGHIPRADGAAWLSVLLNAALVPHTPVAPLTGANVGAQLDASAGLHAAGFSKSFTSSAQAITSGGALTLAHGLGVKPKLVIARITCVTANGGYSIGDTIELGAGLAQTGNFPQGHSIYTDATNIGVRFGDATQLYLIRFKTDGTAFDITNSSWTIQFIAFA